MLVSRARYVALFLLAALLVLPAVAGARPLKKRTWLGGVTLTEYWPAPERWFKGRAVTTPGLPGKHRIDWLYSAQGVSMEGEGVDLQGHLMHIDALGDAGWVDQLGRPAPIGGSGFTRPPFWRAGAYWRNKKGQLTYPLLTGGWSNDRGVKYVPLPGVSFAPGASLPLTYWRSVAVDPDLIPIGSLIYIPAYKSDAYGGWFRAEDTGGAINGKHLDLYRPPPASPSYGDTLSDQRVLVRPGNFPPPKRVRGGSSAPSSSPTPPQGSGDSTGGSGGATGNNSTDAPSNVGTGSGGAGGAG